MRNRGGVWKRVTGFVCSAVGTETRVRTQCRPVGRGMCCALEVRDALADVCEGICGHILGSKGWNAGVHPVSGNLEKREVRFVGAWSNPMWAGVLPQ